MSEYAKIATTHLRRAAVVYVRQSSASQLERNRESTDRQYALVERAVELGLATRVGAGDRRRPGRVRLPRHRALRVHRVDQPGRARPGRDRAGVGGVAAGPHQHRLVPAAGSGRADRHAARRHRRRLPPRPCSTTGSLLGLKGTMAEAELHVLRARLDGGIRNKAERGELRRGLPVGLVWGEEPRRDPLAP